MQTGPNQMQEVEKRFTEHAITPIQQYSYNGKKFIRFRHDY
jgi:hypothetical protein